MLNIKKYANGRFFDTAAKKYIKPEQLAEIIQKGEEIKVTLTKTGKDITDSVISQFSEKSEQRKEKKSKKSEKQETPFLKTDKLTKWIGDVIDSKIEKVMNVVKLPTREQVAQLDKSIKELNKNIDALKASQEKAAKKKSVIKKPAAGKAAAPRDKKPAKDSKPDTDGKTETHPA